MDPTNQCVGLCNATVHMAPAAISRSPGSVPRTPRVGAAIAAARPITAPLNRIVFPAQTGMRKRANFRNAARVDAPDLVRVAVHQHPVGLHLRDDPPEPERLEIGVPGQHGGLDTVQIAGEIHRCSCPRFSHSACSPP